MSAQALERIIQSVQRHALLLADEWQEHQVKAGSTLSPSDYHDPRLFLSWYRLDSLYFYWTDEAFLSAAYQQVLGRAIDEEGKRLYSDLLAKGLPRIFVILDIVHSPEANQFKGLPRLSWFKPLWLGDKLLKRVVSSRIRQGYWQMIHFWEKRRMNQLVMISAWYDQVQTMLQRQKQLEGYLFEQNATLTQQIATSQAMVVTLQQEQQLLRHQLNYQQGVFQQVIDVLNHPADTASLAVTAQTHQQDWLDAYYVAFEDANRGSREEIRAKHQPYLSLIHQHLQAQPQLTGLAVLDVGCGRGEWLRLLSEQGLSATGVDMNGVMVTACREQGLSAQQADLLQWLGQQADASHLLITGFHIIEHLPFEVLFKFFAEAYRVLAPKGMLIVETPNPENVLVGSHTFYHDFTHRNPITPTAIQFLARYHNFTGLDILRLHPYPAEARVAGHDALTERVNGHLTGPQDFALVAIKPDCVVTTH